MLDEATFSSTALIYLLAKLNLHLPNLHVVSIETRPEFVDLAELEFIARVLSEGDTTTHLEVAIGFEVFDDHIRNHVFQKGLVLHTFERLAKDLASYGFRLKCYFMQKPVPEMTDDEAILDIHRAIEYLSRIAREYDVVINMHLNATYVGAGTPLESALREGRYSPPRLQDLAAAARHARHQPITVFLGLYDEGLAVEGGSPVRPGDERLVAILEEFNRTQDYDLLDSIRRWTPVQPMIEDDQRVVWPCSVSRRFLRTFTCAAVRTCRTSHSSRETQPLGLASSWSTSAANASSCRVTPVE